MLKRIRHFHLPILMQINEFLFKWILKSLVFHHRPCAQFTTSIKYFRLCADFCFFFEKNVPKKEEQRQKKHLILLLLYS